MCVCNTNENGNVYRHSGTTQDCACPPAEEVCVNPNVSSHIHHYTNLIFVCVCVCVCVYERKGHRKLFDPSLKSRFLCIAALRRYKSSRLKQLATALAKY